MLFAFRRFRVRRRVSLHTRHYRMNKEAARAFVHARITVLNNAYGFSWGRIAIRNQKRCWGSCSSKRNLNFNYRILFLPPRLQDYLIVHELCHLVHFNHSPAFWGLVAQTIPDYRARKRELARVGVRSGVLEVA